MTSKFRELLIGFSEWIAVRTAKAFPNEQVVYVIRVVDDHGVPLNIQRARKVDELGIINIGSGYGSSRLWTLHVSIDLANKEAWNQSKHHQLMLWWVMCDFDSLEGFRSRNLEVTWKSTADKEAARKLESDLLWTYKMEFADIPIGNLKTW
jgi:hypothetical protein